jgi:hypothetical protein
MKLVLFTSLKNVQSNRAIMKRERNIISRWQTKGNTLIQTKQSQIRGLATLSAELRNQITRKDYLNRLMDREFRKEYFSIAEKILNITDRLDWYTISFSKLVRHCGGGCIAKYYDKDMRKAMNDIYPEIKWEEAKFCEEHARKHKGFRFHSLRIIGNHLKRYIYHHYHNRLHNVHRPHYYAHHHHHHYHYHS